MVLLVHADGSKTFRLKSDEILIEIDSNDSKKTDCQAEKMLFLIVFSMGWGSELIVVDAIHSTKSC